ncbi:MAG: XTP/dITP diphosphatase [Clostridiales bacterium]|jgi:XTP/dITP diphosphohydrolase|nr:XTP/dITP diphosphatase [Clostridiales bacterium]
MRRIIAATNNPGKIVEIRQILNDLPFEILSLKDAGINIKVEEDGDSFEENALKKALEIHKFTGQSVLADDSGLEVAALNGQPGVYSARFAGENATDEENNAKLLKMMELVPFEKRQAVFRCVIVLVRHDGMILRATGACCGKIGFTPAGKGGFGYDPLFIVDGLDKTFAELTPEEKNVISHRGIALKNLKNLLVKQGYK